MNKSFFLMELLQSFIFLFFFQLALNRTQINKLHSKAVTQNKFAELFHSGNVNLTLENSVPFPQSHPCGALKRFALCNQIHPRPHAHSPPGRWTYTGTVFVQLQGDDTIILTNIEKESKKRRKSRKV